MGKRKSTPLENQPFFIQFAYLDLSDEEAVNDFLESIFEIDDDFGEDEDDYTARHGNTSRKTLARRITNRHLQLFA